MSSRFSAALAATCLLAAACSSEGGEPRELSVVLITLDTTRADALGCFGGRAEITPHIDALARESVAYDWARTVTPTTLPAHASVLTGLYPHRHTVRDNGLNALPPEAATLAELLAARGYRTAAFVSASVLDRVFGLDQGFESYSQPARSKTVVSRTTYATRPGAQTAKAACAWLAALDADARFFTWIHFFDPHRPYRSRGELLERAGGDPYLASVALADEAVGSVLDQLRELGRLDDTLVVLVADHGEGLGQHDEATHAAFVYDSTLRVPLLVRHPDGARAGERSDATVSVVDVLPTVCDALALAPPEDLDGLSLWRSDVERDRGVGFESYYAYLRFGMSPLAGWVDHAGKYVHSPSPELYQPANDPGELADLAAQRADDLARYRERLREVFARPALTPTAPELDAGTRADLRQLGYVEANAAGGALPSPLEPSDRPSPHACAQEIAQVETAMELGSKGQVVAALALVDQVLARRPDQPFALEYRGYYLLASGRADEAAASLEHALAIGVERASVHRQLAACRLAQGRVEDAEVQLGRALELDPGDVEALRALRELLIKRGATREADEVRIKLQRALGY